MSMKLFVLGIDAAFEDIFYAFDTPYIRSKFEECRKVNIKEDLFSRGWVESYTGKHAVDTKGFYEMPKADNNYEWSLSFGLKNLDHEVIPIWKTLNDRGVSVGFMNVPTTSPCPEVNGFFVGGGGGGRALNEGFNDSFCKPSRALEILNNLDYIVDERVPSLLFDKKLFDVANFFKQIEKMVELRVDAYLKLQNHFDVDFGFFAFRALATVNYLCMSEVNTVIRQEKPIDRGLNDRLRKFYNKFDQQVERLFKGLNPENCLIMSDHGMVQVTHYVNFNIILRDIGYQSIDWKKSFFKKTVLRLKGLIPYRVKVKLKKKQTVKIAYKSMVEFDPEKTEAFSSSELGEVSGIFINDNTRFKGPIREDHINVKAKEIVKNLNETKFFKEYGFKAILKSGCFQEGKYYKLLPDIIIEKGDSFKCLSVGPLIRENQWAKKPYKLKEVNHDNWTGGKAKDTLLFSSKELIDNIEFDNQKNLTVVYKIIDSYFK